MTYWIITAILCGFSFQLGFGLGVLYVFWLQNKRRERWPKRLKESEEGDGTD